MSGYIELIMTKPVYWILTLIMAICLGLMVLILPKMSDKAYVLPFYSLLLGEWLFAACVLVMVQFGALCRSMSNLRLAPALVSLGLILIIGAIGVLFSPLVQVMDGGLVSLSAGQLVLMNVGMLLSILILEHAHNLNSHFALIDIPGVGPWEKLIFYFKKIVTGKNGSVAEELEATNIKRMKEVERERELSKDLPPEIRRLPSAHAAKAHGKNADPNRPVSSVTAKLRSLSASGTGRLTQSQGPQNEESEQSGLRAVLDRMDAMNEQTGEQIVLQIDNQGLTPASGIFAEPVDKEMDDIFNKIASPVAQGEVENYEMRNAPDLKEFGRLSAEASTQVESTGTMKSIGKLLIDPESVENIIKKAEAGKVTVDLSSARVVSALVGQGIETLLQSIDQSQGVAGSMLVGEDGLVIASTFATVADREGTGALSHGLLSSSNLAMGRLDFGKVEQMIMVSKGVEDNRQRMTTVFTDVGGATLAVFLKTYLLTGLEEVLEKIRTVACG